MSPGPRWETWLPADVSLWIAHVLNLPQYSEAFTVHEVDGPTLLELTEETLQNPLGIIDPIHRKKVLGHTKLLKIQSEAPESMAQFKRTIRRTASGGSRSRKTSARSADSGQSTPYSSSIGAQDRLYQNGFSQTAPLPQGAKRSFRDGAPWSARSVGSLDSAGGASMNSTWGLGEEGSVYSCYINPDPKCVAGLTSLFGVDSPSFSRRGTFSTSPRQEPFSGMQRESPGPDSYNTNTSMFGSGGTLRNSPRATIGRSTRNTAEYVAPAKMTPGVGRYSPEYYPQAGFNCTFGNTDRMHYRSRQQKNWLGLKNPPRPGPADYRPVTWFDSTLKRR